MSRVKLPSAVPLLVLLGLYLVSLGCGGLLLANLPLPAPQNSSAEAVAVSISPPKAALNAGDSLQFTATSYGPPPTDLEWLVNGVPGGNSALGTISRSGLYTAPQQVTSNTVIVIAVSSKTDPTRASRSSWWRTSASSATVTVVPRPVAITVSLAPGVASLYPSQAQQFTATVKGTTNQEINWFVNGNEGGDPSIGKISSSGTYTAPLSAPDVPVTITAMSTYDTARSATAAVTIMAALAGTIPGAGAPGAAVASATGTAPAGATTYYVDNCVTVGNDTNNGTSTSTPWLTIAHVNAHPYNPGDSILFQSTCTWREELIPPSSGSSGDPITFGAYGTRTAPIISGGDLITGFTVNVSNPNIWNATVTTQPNIAIINGSVGTLKASAAAIAAPGDWYWTANTLSVYGTSDPSGTVVAGARNAVIDIGSNSYVTVTGLTVTASNATHDGAVRGSTSDNVVIQSNTITQTAGYAVALLDMTNLTLDSNTVSYSGSPNGAGGTIISSVTNGLTYGPYTISNNIIHDTSLYGIFLARNSGTTSRHSAASIYGNTVYNNATGIYIQATDNSTIHDNIVHNNTIATSDGDTYGMGIENCNSNTFYNNKIYNNAGDGIDLYGTDNANWGPSNDNVFYNNLIYGHTIASNTGDKIGFLLASSTDGYINRTLIYNNVFYGNSIDLAIALAGTGNAIDNNTFYGAADRSVWFEVPDPGGVDVENNIFAASANTPFDANTANTNVTHANNLYYKASGTLANYNGTSYTSANIATWEATAVTGNPAFTNAGTADFTLQLTSSAINAGGDLGATYKLGLDPRSSFPWSTVSRGGNGSGWDIGAFVYLSQ
jgi:parallel beta-helix repeat protein